MLWLYDRNVALWLYDRNVAYVMALLRKYVSEFAPLSPEDIKEKQLYVPRDTDVCFRCRKRGKFLSRLQGNTLSFLEPVWHGGLLVNVRLGKGASG